ncbi:MAG: PAS domain S-box protein [Armatimonadetes bacterium]|nr:PAS domain S-box protein [Armatimonadota bacterium]
MTLTRRPALSVRERQLLKCAAAGLTDSAIAVRLGISEATVKTYWRRIRAKLGRNSRTELVATVLKQEIAHTNGDRSRFAPLAGSQEDRFYRLLLEQAPDAIMVVRSDGIIQMVNESAADLFGWEVDDLTGRPVSDLVPNAFRSAHDSHFNSYMESPSRRAMGDHIATIGLHRSGIEMPIAANLSAIGDGDDVSVVCIVRSLHLPK